MRITKILSRTIVALLALVYLPACNFINEDHVRGSGHIIREERQVQPFRELKVLGTMNVELTQGATKAATIEGDDNLIPLIELKEEGDKLIVKVKEGYDISSKSPVVVYLTTETIRGATIAGSGDLKMTGKFNSAEDVKFSLAGSGNFTGAINAPEVKASIAGSGNMDLAGETKDLEVNIAGSGNYVGDELMAENVKVKIAGSGNADVYASVKLDAKIAGSGDVNYKGTPQISSNVTGSGSVTQK